MLAAGLSEKVNMISLHEEQRKERGWDLVNRSLILFTQPKAEG